MNPIKVGDRVRIKSYPEIKSAGKMRGNKLYSASGLYFNPSMKEYCGKTLFVTDIGYNQRFYVSATSGGSSIYPWTWCMDWVAAVNEDEDEDLIPILF